MIGLCLIHKQRLMTLTHGYRSCLFLNEENMMITTIIIAANLNLLSFKEKNVLTIVQYIQRNLYVSYILVHVTNHKVYELLPLLSQDKN